MMSRARRATLRRVVRELVRPGDDLDTVIRRLADRRGRALRVAPYPESVVTLARRRVLTLPYGIWLGSETLGVDQIYYRADLSVVHRGHVVAHELGHVALGHGTPLLESRTSLLTAVRARGGTGCGGHTVYTSPAERDAEEFAYLLEARLDTLGSLPQPTDDDPVAQRFAAILGGSP